MEENLPHEDVPQWFCEQYQSQLDRASAGCLYHWATSCTHEELNEGMFNDTPAQNINRLLGVRQMVS